MADTLRCVLCRRVLGDLRLRVSSNIEIFTQVYNAVYQDDTGLSDGALSCRTCKNAIETASRALLNVETLGLGPLQTPALSNSGNNNTESDPAQPPLTPTKPSIGDEIALRAFLKQVSTKARELSTSIMFARCGGKPIEEFRVKSLSDFFQSNGGIVAEIVRAITGKEDPLGEVVAVAILLNQRSQKASSLQKVLGVTLRASGCDKDVSHSQFSPSPCID